MSCATGIECVGSILLADYFTNGTRKGEKYGQYICRYKMNYTWDQERVCVCVCQVYGTYYDEQFPVKAHRTCFDWNKNAKKHLPC